ncbi:hypothetical protein KSS87_021007 [Heliosperma pusillum]|nr:hypothetical protein KSS87_021007 [Heliosperma pusillum]
METPSSTRRITRSHTKAVLSNTTNMSSKKVDESAKNGAKKSKQRSCLFDITNDSPIIGLASGNLSETPVSSMANPKRSSRCKKTTGSGEALLRSQVKTLLQKVEEEAEISKFLSFDVVSSRHSLGPFLTSPISLLAPTPTNTPQVFSFNSAIDECQTVVSVVESSVEAQLTESKVVNQKSENGPESEKDIISRSLFLDFLEKSDSSPDCSTVMTKEDDDDDDESVWSIQVNVSTHDEDENVLQIDELCEGIKKISVKEDMEIMGKHIRFVYNSDDELVEEEVEGDVLRLKGLPTPKGKHLRFQDEDDD